jgi:Kef-type K+ transport system membrane component KefB
MDPGVAAHADATQLPELLILGALLLAGFFAHAIGRSTHVPRVTLLLVLGIAAGPAALDLIPSRAAEWFPQVTHVALAMVGFLLGESFAGREIRESGRVVLAVSIAVTIGSALAVFAATAALGADLAMALLLAGIAPATAPAATLDVVREYAASGPLTRTVLEVVAIDDAWGVILFSLLLVVAESLAGQAGSAPGIDLLRGLWDVVGALVLGIVVGVPMAWMTGRIQEGEPTLIEAAGFVFICGGLALLLHVSYLLACMALGATVANRATHHTRPFREIEGASQPFLVMFFLLAGYECDLGATRTLGSIGVGYVVARVAGRVLAARLAARAAGAPEVVQRHVGWCLLPQAGIALGLALLATDRLPQLADTLLPLVISATVVFELVGPATTWWHLDRAGELGRA